MTLHPTHPSHLQLLLLRLILRPQTLKHIPQNPITHLQPLLWINSTPPQTLHPTPLKSPPSPSRTSSHCF